MKCRCRWKGVDQLPLLVGMTANVEVETEPATQMLLVPSIALAAGAGRVSGVVGESRNDPQGAPIVTPVQVGLSDGTFTQVVEGLKEGDEVVVQSSSERTAGTGMASRAADLAVPGLAVPALEAAATLAAGIGQGQWQLEGFKIR